MTGVAIGETGSATLYGSGGRPRPVAAVTGGPACAVCPCGRNKHPGKTLALSRRGIEGNFFSHFRVVSFTFFTFCYKLINSEF